MNQRALPWHRSARSPCHVDLHNRSSLAGTAARDNALFMRQSRAQSSRIRRRHMVSVGRFAPAAQAHGRGFAAKRNSAAPSPILIPLRLRLSGLQRESLTDSSAAKPATVKAAQSIDSAGKHGVASAHRNQPSRARQCLRARSAGAGVHISRAGDAKGLPPRTQPAKPTPAGHSETTPAANRP